jgi:DNA primase
MKPTISIRLVFYTDQSVPGDRWARTERVPDHPESLPDSKEGRADTEKARSALQGSKEELYSLYSALAVHWQNSLKTDPEAAQVRAYLKKLDFSDHLVEEFGLGYAPYSLEALENGRLIMMSESGKRHGFFRGRLMIPIHAEWGQVVAFSGRLLDPDSRVQRYINSPETPIFSRGRVLFGLHKAKRPIIEANCAIICEGQIDLMRCWQHGIRNVVAPQGIEFTHHQGRTLRRLAEEVVICFDSDRAGERAAEQAIGVLLKEDLQIRIARIPPNKDPDSLLREQPTATFETILREAKDYTLHLLDTACEEEDIASPRGRGAVAAQMAQVIARIANAVERDAFLLDVARRLEVSRSAVEEEVYKAEAQQRNHEGSLGA